MGHEVSEVIEQLVGLRQGCVLSPCLFTLYIADLPAWLEAAGTRGVLLHDTWVRVLLYADDGVLVADSEEDLQEMLGALRGYCAKWRLFVNVAKTKGMVCGGSRLEKPTFRYDGHVIEIVNEFVYLGVMIHQDGGTMRAAEHRMLQAKRLVAVWK